MSENTKIQWASDTFNPWWGCVKTSAGCEKCYADAWAKRTGHPVWGMSAPRRMLSEANWRKPLKWNREAERSGETRRVFCASMCDVFEDCSDGPSWREVDSARRRLFELIEATPALTWMLLTKRPENMVTMAPARWRDGWPRNVWAMASAENQAQLDKRAPHLLGVPAVVHGISAEPMLGPLNLMPALGTECTHEGGYSEPETNATVCAECDEAEQIDWVIGGGESGPGARPCRVDWIESILDQCKAAGVAAFCKQLGSNILTPGQVRWRTKHSKGGDPSEWHESLRVREFPA